MVLVPVHVSAGSHAPVEARHTVPAFPAGCWQVMFDPSHRSTVQTLPSSVHAVPDAFLASAGHVAAEPVHVSARSHSPAAARQTVAEERKVQVAEQHAPPSTMPLPHAAAR